MMAKWATSIRCKILSPSAKPNAFYTDKYTALFRLFIKPWMLERKRSSNQNITIKSNNTLFFCSVRWATGLIFFTIVDPLMCVWHRVYVCSMYSIYKGHAHLVSYELFADYVMTVRGMLLTATVKRCFCSSFLVMKFVCFMPSVYVTYRDIIQYCDTARWPIFIKKSFTVHIFFFFIWLAS